jgi:two-component system CheB/CheR fusion protein
MNPSGDSSETNSELDNLLNYLLQSRGFDFTGYKRASLTRRVIKRMQEVGIGAEDFGSYLDYLEVHPEEFPQLFNTILINVTTFFRDPAAWERLSATIIPRLLSAKRTDEPIRIWSAGCASGEEAFSMAMAFAEAMGIESFRERVKIFATDVDEEALNKARHAVYALKEVEGIPAPLLEKYFEPVNHQHCFLKGLRRAVIFGRNDLIQDAPISRIDLLACRNTLIYFNTEIQARILDRFHFALGRRGILFLGKAETVLTYSSLFNPVDLKLRLFSKVPATQGRERLPLLSRIDDADAGNQASVHALLRASAFDAGLTAQMVLDVNGILMVVNEKAQALFHLAPTDLGRPLQDLEISYRPVELRSCLESAFKDRRTVTRTDVSWSPSDGETVYLDVQVVPLFDPSDTLLGACVTFLDGTSSRQLKDKLDATTAALQGANEELQSTNEELETTNEELQSANEELETTNEELQSTNEELETMNEELQSTNEELETVNLELNLRSNELNRSNASLESILASIRRGLIVVNDDLVVQTWNTTAEDLWGLRSEEVQGKNLLGLEMGLPIHELRPPIRACLNGQEPFQELTTEATTRRGRRIRCRVTCTPMLVSGEIRGAILLMEEDGDAPQPSHDGPPRISSDGAPSQSSGDVPKPPSD